MRIQIEINEHTLRHIIFEYVREHFKTHEIDAADIVIEVKSKQNYRAEWETAAFRARLDKQIGSDE